MDENAWEGPLQEFGHAELRSNTCIRLVQIHTELFRGDISCTLQQYESGTGTCPDYAALSYVWGDPTPTHTIYINKRVYRVHKSLWEFLSHRRTKENAEHTWLWTDLLCIDQAHHSEKNEQISRMGDIYAQAAYVVSWLGTQDETAQALRTLVEINEDIETGCTPVYARNTPESDRIQKACDQLGLIEPYWDRVWVLQEVACAKDCIVACGDTYVNFEDVQRKMDIAMRSCIRLDTFDRDRRMERIGVLADLKTSIYQGKTINFLELIGNTSFCKATREQDNVYGLLGIAGRLDSEFDSRVLEVSQQKSLTDVWWDIIFMISYQESNISIKRDLDNFVHLIGRIPPPHKHSELETSSSIRRACAETASQVSEAAYSTRIQDFLGINHSSRGYCATVRARQRLQTAWDTVTTHVYEHDVPGLQTRLGWSAYAGLRFTSWHNIEKESTGTSVKSLPVGWLCAAHWPDIQSTIMAKKCIFSTFWYVAPQDDLFGPTHCSEAEHGAARCDLSLVVLKIQQLGVTCLVRSRALHSGENVVGTRFYCDCCDQATIPEILQRRRKMSRG